MSKRLRLGSLPTSRSLRSGKITADVDSSEKTSSYFEESEPSATTKTRTRKQRSPVKIKRETTEDEGNVQTTGVTLSVNIKSENVKEAEDAQNIKIEQSQVKSEIVEPVDRKNVKKEDQWMPLNWEIILKNIKEMRKHGTAPVDEMGCHKCADPTASPSVSRYQSLVALMLSSQTKDQVTYAAMQRLNSFGCKPDILASIPDEVLGKLIYPVGFWKVYSSISISLFICEMFV